MTHPTTPEQPHPGRSASSARHTVQIIAAVLATITATLALAWFITAPPARGDALCDAMRARFGPGYPCISIPTNTFTPTAPAGPTTTNPGAQSGGGPQVGMDVGPGPGIGNGTPIVPVPGAPTTAAPGTNRAPAGTPTTPEIPAGQTQPGQQTAQPAPSSTPRTPAPTPSQPTPSATPAPAGTSGPTQRASVPVPGDNSSDQTTQMLWLLAGAAAIVAGASTARSGGVGRYRAAATANGYPTTVAALRSWLPGGGSERARIGNSQYVLINDPTSPDAYTFDVGVPPGGHISVNPDGTATIYNRNGQPVSTIAKPWAYDSLGRPQRTWYTVDNNGDLVQHVDAQPNALYPILADPDKNALALARQQQQAAQQGTPAHEPGTGTPLNKSPNADPPPPPPATPPPANTPDYGGDPHNQAGTHSGLPPSQTSSGPDLDRSTQQPGTSNADPVAQLSPGPSQVDPGPAPTSPESDNQAATDTALASISGPYTSQEQADSALYALQRQHLRSEGFRVTNAGVDPRTHAPLIEVTNPNNGQQFVIPQTKDSAGGLPGTGVPNYNQVPTLSAPGQVTRIIPVRQLPAGFSDPDGTSPLTRTYAPDVVIDAANTPGAITAPQKLVIGNKGEGTLGGGTKVPGVNVPIGPKAAPLNAGIGNGAPGFEPGTANKALPVNADRVAKIRVVGANPTSATTFNYGGVNALSVNYQYQYQIQNVYTGGLNGAPYVVYESPWSQISPDQANALGLKLPTINAPFTSPSK